MARIHTAFVSSTFLDLKDERTVVVQMLLRSGFLPIAMEFLPANPLDAEEVLTDLIENAFFLRMLATYPDINPSLVEVSDILTRVKRTCWYISLWTFIGSFVVVVGRAGWQAICRRSDDVPQ